MIPLSLTLKGFLSFREEQRLDFDRDQVWLLSGPNGSGKSTVFDAILFTLYAGHRAGKADLHELINKGCDRTAVQFEFLLDGRRHRAERTAERTVDRRTGRPGYTSAQQLYMWNEQDDGGWQPIPGTHRQGDFNEWVREHIGLSFDAFTSSALLMQGRAEVLVAQDAEAAKRRFEVLARIVGLDYYERLHRQADELRKKYERQADSLQDQLRVIDPVGPAELEELQRQADELGAACDSAEREAEALRRQRDAATTWMGLTVKRAGVMREREEVRRLLGDAEQITRDGERWQELRAVLPLLERFAEQRRQTAEAAAAVRKLEGARRDRKQRIEQADAANASLREALALAEGAQAEDEQQRRRLADELRDLDVVLPVLRRLRRDRDALRELRAVADAAAEQARAAEEVWRRKEARLPPARQKWEAAVTTLRRAADDLAQTEARRKMAQDQCRRFEEIASAQTCGYCGQVLTAEHALRERQRLDAELRQRAADHDAAGAAYARGAEHEARLQKGYEDAGRELTSAAQRLEELRRERDRAEDQARLRLVGVREAYEELPPAARSRVAAAVPGDWLATNYPTERDLAALDQRRADLVRRARELQQTAAERQANVRRLRDQLKEQEAALKGLRDAMGTVEMDFARWSERLAGTQDQLKRLIDLTPETWRDRAARFAPTDFPALADEFQSLTAHDAHGRLERLRDARLVQERLGERVQQLDAELDAIPADARRDPRDLDAPLDAALNRGRQLRDGLSALRERHRLLRERLRHRERLAEEHRAADRRRHLSARLAELLSRRQLQRHLLRRAESGIVENTNRVLDRITAGQICVRLLPEEDNADNRALQLEACKTALGQSFGLSFLSGSERFRVAIGLALGIGQFASRQHRAIESVIIDEGFGCLDRQNRRTIIDELNHLRGQLRCILLVSHQEEFADAFPEGYRFTFADGTSRVERSE
jgi:DNA repair exonuclease SbcCD ATPase subunit